MVSFLLHHPLLILELGFSLHLDPTTPVQKEMQVCRCKVECYRAKRTNAQGSSCTVLVGVDASRTFIEYARAQAVAAQISDRVEFHVADALRMLEFPDHYFDLVNHRSAVSWIRTWDWPKLLQEYQRVCHPEGVIRITEPEWAIAKSSPALLSLTDLSSQAFYQAGHYFIPTRDGITSKLVHLLQQHGLQQIQTRPHTLEYHAGTNAWQSLFEHNKLGFRMLVPFLHKWAKVPENYEEIYQQMLSEMQQMDFVATWNLLTAWGHPQPSKEVPDSNFARLCKKAMLTRVLNQLPFAHRA